MVPESEIRIFLILRSLSPYTVIDMISPGASLFFSAKTAQFSIINNRKKNHIKHLLNVSLVSKIFPFFDLLFKISEPTH